MLSEQCVGGNFVRGSRRFRWLGIELVSVLIYKLRQAVAERRRGRVCERGGHPLHEARQQHVVGADVMQEIALGGIAERLVEIFEQPLVFFAADQFAIEWLVRLDELRGAVGRGVVEDDHTVGAECLCGERIERGANEAFPVVDRDDGDDARPIAHDCCASSLIIASQLGGV